MGWKGQSRRHSLARKGVKTANGNNKYILPDPEAKPSHRVGIVEEGHFWFYRNNKLWAVPILENGTLEWGSIIDETELKAVADKGTIGKVEIQLEPITELIKVSEGDA